MASLTGQVTKLGKPFQMTNFDQIVIHQGDTQAKIDLNSVQVIYYDLVQRQETKFSDNTEQKTHFYMRKLSQRGLFYSIGRAGDR